MDHFSHAETTGRWWEHAWWDDPNCETFLRIPVERVRAGAAVIRRYFDDAWYLTLSRKPRKNILMANLCQQSTFAAEFIASFGERLEKLKDAQNVMRPIRAIRQGDGHSAFLELETAEGFAECGFTVSFPAELANQRTPDVLAVKESLSLAIEVKRLGDEEWEDWESALMRRLSFALPYTHQDQDIVVNVVLNPRLSEIRFGSRDKPDALNDAISGAIVETLLGAIREALADGRLPVQVLIHDIAKVQIAKKEPGAYGGVSGMERSVPNTFRRMFQNGIFRALEQLPKGSPSAIVVYSKHMPPTAFFRLFFDAVSKADRDRFKDVVGVMVCTLNTWFERVQPVYYANTHSAHPDASRIVAETFIKTFSALCA